MRELRRNDGILSLLSTRALSILRREARQFPGHHSPLDRLEGYSEDASRRGGGAFRYWRHGRMDEGKRPLNPSPGQELHARSGEIRKARLCRPECMSAHALVRGRGSSGPILPPPPLSCLLKLAKKHRVDQNPVYTEEVGRKDERDCSKRASCFVYTVS